MSREKRFRSTTIEEKAINEELRTVELAFSSETPYERSFGLEVLNHDAGSADLSRIDGQFAPLLLNHDPDQVIGVIESARIDPDRVGRAVVRFGESQLADEIFRDVVNRIRRLVSVGYYVDEVEKVEKNEDGLDTYHVKFTPIEISLVPLPADPSVGIGRSVDSEEIKPAAVTKSSTEEPKKMSEDNSTLTVEASPRIEVNESQIRKAEAKRSRELIELGSKYDALEEAKRAIDEGQDTGSFSRWILENRKQTPEPSPASQDDGEIGLSEKEIENYSLTRAINGFCNTGRFDGIEAEASEAAKKRYGRNVDGLVVPTDVLKRDLNVTTAVDGGNTVATDLLSGSFIDLLRNASVVAQTGATYLNGLSGDVAIPRQSQSATASWRTEVQAVSESSAQIDQVTLSPKALTAMTTYSKQLLAQSSIDVESFVRRDLAATLAVAQDLAAVNGSGSAPEPQGIVGTSGIGSVTIGTNPVYTGMVNLEKEVAIDNALNGNLSYVGNANAVSKLKRTEIATNTARFVLEDGMINGYPLYVSNQMPSTGSGATATTTMLFGNFSDLLIGNWNGIDVVVDPYSSAANRQVRLVVSLWTDIAVRHPESFAKVTDLKYNA